MRPLCSLLRLAAVLAAFVVAHCMPAKAGAGEEAAPAGEVFVAQESALADLRSGQRTNAAPQPASRSQPDSPSDITLGTGDGQQGSAAGHPLACFADTGCTP